MQARAAGGNNVIQRLMFSSHKGHHALMYNVLYCSTDCLHVNCALKPISILTLVHWQFYMFASFLFFEKLMGERNGKLTKQNGKGCRGFLRGNSVTSLSSPSPITRVRRASMPLHFVTRWRGHYAINYEPKQQSRYDNCQHFYFAHLCTRSPTLITLADDTLSF